MMIILWMIGSVAIAAVASLWDTEPPVTEEQILSAVGAWMLCCAVGAENRTLSTSGNLDFDAWWICCEMPARVAKELGISQIRVREIVKAYAVRNARKTYMQVFEEEKKLHPDKDRPK